MIKYRHYSNKRLYKILHDDVFNIDTHKRCVVYQDCILNTIYVREYNEFFEILVIKNEEISRFSIIKD